MRKWVIVAFVSGLAAAAAVHGWHSSRQPKRDKYVLINETSRHDYDLALRMSLKLAEKKSGIENALVILPALPAGRSIEDTAAELFSNMQIGARRGGRGILYMYSAKENLLKIEVSYALEQAITDGYCGQLEEAAKTYMLSEVPQDFLSELIITTNLRGMSPKGEASETEPMTRPPWLNAEFLSGGAGAIVHGYSKTLEDYQRAIQHLPDAQLNQFSASTDAGTTVQRYLLSLALGVGDPRLPLLTEGTRVFRAVVPRDDAQQKRIARFLDAAAPYRMLYADDLALVVPQPGQSNLPIVLRRGLDGLWYVDEPKAWTYFHRYEDDVNFFVKYGDNPFLPQLRAMQLPHMDLAIYDNHARTPHRPVYPFALAQAVKEMEDRIAAAPDVAAHHAALGDLYLFEMDWLTKAITSYERAEALDPSELKYRWRLVDLYLNASRADKFLAELKFLTDHLPDDKNTRDRYEYYRQEYAFTD